MTTMDELKREYEELNSRREDIEGTIQELMKLLEENKDVGLTGPLVDTEGYPRSDIDVYSVRHARHQIACLQNDHKAIMKDVEEKMYEIHAKAKETKTVDSGTPSSVTSPQLKPFLMVNEVAQGGPAHKAGIGMGDQIKQFGSITADNFKTLQDIGLVVQHSKDKIVKILVDRGGKDKSLELTPHVWSGRGLLGCNVVPLNQ